MYFSAKIDELKIELEERGTRNFVRLEPIIVFVAKVSEAFST